MAILRNNHQMAEVKICLGFFELHNSVNVSLATAENSVLQLHPKSISS